MLSVDQTTPGAHRVRLPKYPSSAPKVGTTVTTILQAWKGAAAGSLPLGLSQVVEVRGAISSVCTGPVQT